MALEIKIVCNGVAPSKAEVYTLAAEFVEVEEITNFKTAIIEALKSYDNYDNYDYYDYYYYYDYDYYYYYDYLTQEEKVIAMLFLAAIYY